MGKCSTCGLAKVNGGMCPVFKADMNQENGCPKYADNLNTCEICGGFILPKGEVFFEDYPESTVYHILCGSCAFTKNPCQTCSIKECRFQSDTSCTEPAQMPVVRRQGNTTFQTIVINPKRIEATCAQGCPCYNAEGVAHGEHCFRQRNEGCANHKYPWEKVSPQ